jgi:uncharacterized tellurite resistance protein B-like protein
MLRTLNQLLGRLAPQSAAAADDEHALQLATAVLLVEVSRADTDFGDDERKLRIVRALWGVAFADGRLCAHEEHLMRRVADLLHVPHAANMIAKLREAEAAQR